MVLTEVINVTGCGARGLGQHIHNVNNYQLCWTYRCSLWKGLVSVSDEMGPGRRHGPHSQERLQAGTSREQLEGSSPTSQQLQLCSLAAWLHLMFLTLTLLLQNKKSKITLKIL